MVAIWFISKYSKSIKNVVAFWFILSLSHEIAPTKREPIDRVVCARYMLNIQEVHGSVSVRT
jgi:hypothetical protein